MSNWTIRGYATLLLPVLVFTPHEGLHGQNPEEIFAHAMELHAERLADVEDVTIHQEILGIPVTTHLVKETVDGRPVLRAVEVGAPGMGTGPMEGLGDLWADPALLYTALGDRWMLEGAGSIDGRETWRLVLTEVERFELGPGVPVEGELNPHRVELELDADDLVPRVVTMHGEVERSGEPAPFTLRVELSEYRETKGYLHPHVTGVETDFGAAAPSNTRLEIRVREVRVNEGRPGPP